MNRFLPAFIKTASGIACLLLGSTSMQAVTTENVVHKGFEELDKGEFQNVGITFDGKIFPTRELSEFASLPASIIWEAVIDSEGQLVISTGNNGTVYKVDEEGTNTVIFQPEEALSRAIAIDGENRIYVGTSPKGRVYRILPDGTQEVFFDPKDLYIWDLEIGNDGHLYIATGGRGKIYRIPLDYHMGDESEVLFEASEIHVNKIAFTPDQSALIIGCGSGGNIYRLELNGDYYALYHSGADEIKSIFPEADGSIYFSTFSSAKTGNGNNHSANGSEKTSKEDDSSEKANPYLFTVFGGDLPEDNGLMKLDAEGNIQTEWSLSPNKIFSILHQSDGRWLIGTGTNGRVFRTEGLTEWSNILAVPSGGEVTQIIPFGSDGELFLISSNPARIYKLGADISEEALYTSEVIDTGKMVDWGALRYLSVTGEFQNHVEISTRSGNIEDPNRSWSEWEALDSNQIASPNSRFVQYKINMLADNPGIQRIQIYYQEQNLHPRINEIRILPGAYRLYSAPKPSKNLSFSKAFSNKASFSSSERIPQLVREKEEGAITAVWMPTDPNHDRMLFDLQVKKIGQEHWLKIASEMEKPIFAMDIRGLEEGYYQLRIIANDRLDNAPGKELKYAKVSDPFLIDVTSPVVALQEIKQTGNSVLISIHASDRFGVIERAYYSLNGGHVLKALPDDGMFDSPEEHFNLELSSLETGEYSLIFKGYDENGNVGVETCQFTVEQ